MRIGLVACVGIVLLAGCSDPKKASNGNFKAAIDAYLVKTPMCINAPTSDTKPSGQGRDASPFPAYVPMPTAPVGQALFAMNTKMFDALVRGGLLRASTGTIDFKSDWGTSNPRLPVRVYNLTDQGQKAFVKATDGNPYSNRFCYGTPAVNEVTQFTEPSAAFGATVSSVAYTYHVKDQAGWATNPAMVEAYPILKQATGDALEGKTDLVLTNNGWVDGRGSKF